MKVRVEFDDTEVVSKMKKDSLTALRRAGAYIRKAARNKVSASKHAAAPGSPPHTRRGLLKNALLFGVEKREAAAVIGPAEPVIGTAMKAHEFGGRYKSQRYPRRPLMAPTLERAAPKLAKFWENTVK